MLASVSRARGRCLPVSAGTFGRDRAGVAHGQALARGILDGTGPVGPAVRRAVDAALRGKSNDPAVHAAALWLAYSAGADLRLSRSQSRKWILGLDELIDCGHLDAAANAAPQLNAAYPRMPYLEHMALIFQHLPAAVSAGRERFVDDRDSDVQVVAMPGADTVVIAFCGARHRLGLSLSLMDRWFAQLGGHVIYLRDRRKVGYTRGVPALGRNMATTIESLRALARDLGAIRVVCTGNSAGASGALRYAGPLGAERVLALAPITGGPEFVRKVAPNLAPDGVTPWTDLVPLYRENNGVRVRILYGEKNEGDREQSLRMAGLPNVTVEAVPDWESHHLIGGLIRARRLQHVLGWLTRDDAARSNAVHIHPTSERAHGDGTSLEPKTVRDEPVVTDQMAVRGAAQPYVTRLRRWFRTGSRVGRP